MYGLHVQKPTYVLHLLMYRPQVQKSFALGNMSNFTSIESFYSGQSFFFLQSFIDLLLILITIIMYFIEHYIVYKYIVNVDFILVSSYFIHDIIGDLFNFTNLRYLSSSIIKIYKYVRKVMMGVMR